MPQNDVKSSPEYIVLQRKLIAARAAYGSRKVNRLFNFVVGATADQSRPATNLVATPDIHLETPDLWRKINYIEARLAELVEQQRDATHRAAAITAATIAPDFAAVISDAKLISEGERKKNEMHTVGNIIRRYRREQDKQEFLEELRDINLMIAPYSLLEEQDILDYANQAIILFNEDNFTDLRSQLRCLEIVNKACSIEYAQFKSTENVNKLADISKYRLAAKTVFRALIDKLPVDMQPLKVLFTMGEYNWVIFFVDRYLEHSDDSVALRLLIGDLHKICDSKCRAKTREQFEHAVTNYADLPKKHRDDLEEQRAYLIMLRSYSYFAGEGSEHQALRDKIREDSNLLDKNIKNVLAQRMEIGVATQEYNRIKQEIADIASNKRSSDRTRKTLAGIKTVYTYPTSGEKTESALTNTGKAVAAGTLAAIGLYLGLDTVSSAAAATAGAGVFGAAVLVPSASFLKADIETKREIFPELQQKLAFLERADLNQVDKVFLTTIDQYMNYDPEKRDYVIPNAELSVKNDNLFKDMYDKFLKQAEEYIASRTEDLKILADKAFLQDINVTRTLIEDVLIAAGKTLAGLIFVTGGTLLAFLLAVGLTGPIVLFAMSPALSVGLVGAAVVAGLKYMYPDHRTTVGFLVDKAVQVIFSPVSLLISGCERLTRPFMALYNAYAEKRTKQFIATAVVAVILGIGLGVAMPIVAASLGVPALGVAGAAIGSLFGGTYLALTAAAACEYLYNKIISNTKVQIFKLERSLAILNLDDNVLERYVSVNTAAPELLPALTRLFKSEVDAIKIKIDSAISGQAAVDLKQLSKELANLEIWWAKLSVNGNNPVEFAELLDAFLSEHYKVVRDRYESAGKERATIESVPYVEQRRPLLSFAKRPDFAMKDVIEYGKEQKSLRDVQSLKQQQRSLKHSLNLD
jgi:hypothetical protein